MSNTFGTHFKVTTFGESHGPAMGGVIDGCPAGLHIDTEKIASDLSRRIGDGLAGVTARRETDEIEWLSGLLDGVSLGTPIAFLLRNSEQRSADYDTLSNLYRPGHGDYTWQQKYGIRDARGGGRCSARETVVRVVAGAVAKQLLAQRGIAITAVAQSKPAPEGDTAGGTVSCTVSGLPVGVGAPLFGKLQSQLAAAAMSIPSATGFEVGEGFRAAQMKGSEYIDRWNNDFTTQTNHCGGIQGGLSNGMPVCFRVAFHPVVTLPAGIPCADINGEEHFVVPGGRHDKNHVERAAVIVEAMTAIVLIDNILSPNVRL